MINSWISALLQSMYKVWCLYAYEWRIHCFANQKTTLEHKLSERMKITILLVLCYVTFRNAYKNISYEYNL